MAAAGSASRGLDDDANDGAEDVTEEGPLLLPASGGDEEVEEGGLCEDPDRSSVGVVARACGARSRISTATGYDSRAAAARAALAAASWVWGEAEGSVALSSAAE